VSGTRALVVGYGSIGARHARVLSELGCSTAVVSSRAVDHPNVNSDLAAALSAQPTDYVVIANATDQHYDTLAQLAELGYEGKVLVEKPLFNRVRPLPEHAFSFVGVAYNLRFHPVIRRLKALVESQQALSVQAYVGQYLPDWRPGADYRTSYSANAERGGGALRDLSHELDYLLWLFGSWEAATALGGHFGPLEISSDDVYSLLVRTRRCPVLSVQLNYLDRRVRRCVIVNTAEHTFEADLVQGTVAIDRTCESFVTDRDWTYREMHQAVLDGRGETVCSLCGALDALRLIEAAEAATGGREWVQA
jgi:predicted dehydrogenase